MEIRAARSEARLFLNRKRQAQQTSLLQRSPDAANTSPRETVFLCCQSGEPPRLQALVSPSHSEQPDNSQVEWYDLDLPEVIELRRKFIGGEGERYHLGACSVLDKAWLDAVSTHRQRPFLFLAEGVFMYFHETEVKSLVLTLKEQFPGAELVCDAFSPFFSWANNLRVTLTKVGARSYWALKHGTDLERWSDGIRLLDERFPFQYPEPRLGRALAVRHIPFFTKTMGVIHYQL